MTRTVKSGIGPANFAMADWESFDVRFGSEADISAALNDVRFTPRANIHRADVNVRFVPIAETQSASACSM